MEGYAYGKSTTNTVGQAWTPDCSIITFSDKAVAIFQRQKSGWWIDKFKVCMQPKNWNAHFCTEIGGRKHPISCLCGTLVAVCCHTVGGGYLQPPLANK